MRQRSRMKFVVSNVATFSSRGGTSTPRLLEWDFQSRSHMCLGSTPSASWHFEALFWTHSFPPFTACMLMFSRQSRALRSRCTRFRVCTGGKTKRQMTIASTLVSLGICIAQSPEIRPPSNPCGSRVSRSEICTSKSYGRGERTRFLGPTLASFPCLRCPTRTS